MLYARQSAEALVQIAVDGCRVTADDHRNQIAVPGRRGGEGHLGMGCERAADRLEGRGRRGDPQQGASAVAEGVGVELHIDEERAGAPELVEPAAYGGLRAAGGFLELGEGRPAVGFEGGDERFVVLGDARDAAGADGSSYTGRSASACSGVSAPCLPSQPAGPP